MSENRLVWLHIRLVRHLSVFGHTPKYAIFQYAAPGI